MIPFIADHQVFQASEGEKEKKDIIGDLSNILTVDEWEMRELIKAYMRDSLMDMVNRVVMQSEETV